MEYNMDGIGDISVSIEMIGPTRATEFLRKAPTLENDGFRNRNLLQLHFQKMAADMSHDQWCFTGEPIIFDVKGRFIEGQNRMQALIKCGKTLPFLVVRGVPENAFEYIGSGRVRTVANVLQSLGRERDTNAIGAMCKYIFLLRASRLDRCGGGTIDETKQDLLKVSKQYQRSIDSALEFTNGVEFTNIAPHSHTAFLRWATCRINPDMSTLFMDLLRNGGKKTDPSESSVAFLRDILISGKARKHTLSKQYRMAISIKAWNAFTRGEHVKCLKWSGLPVAPKTGKKDINGTDYVRIAAPEKFPRFDNEQLIWEYADE